MSSNTGRYNHEGLDVLINFNIYYLYKLKYNHILKVGLLSPSSIKNFHPQKTEMTSIQFKPDFDSSLDSEYKREFNSEDIKLAPVLVLEVINR